MIRSLTKERQKLDPRFLSGLEQFKALVRHNMEIKRSVIEGECITGEGKRWSFIQTSED